MTTLTGQDVAGIYSLFLYLRNIEPIVKNRHILPRGNPRILWSYDLRGGKSLCLFLFASGVEVHAQKPEIKGGIKGCPQNSQKHIKKEVFL
jgi:hypothetical protein